MEILLAEEPKPVGKLAIASQKISSGLIVFENKKDELQQLADECKGFKIDGVDDSEGFKIVSQKRKALKAERVSLQKQGKEMRDGLTQMGRQIMDKEKELIAIIEPVEKELQEEEKRIEEEKERIRLAKIAEEEARIQKRIDGLAEYGFQIDYADIKAMSDETFDKYLDAAKVQHEKEEAEKAEAERLRLEREEKERQEKEAEQKRLDAERAELEKLRQEQADREAKIKAEQEAIAAEKKRIEDEKAAIEVAKQKEIEDKKRAEELRLAQEKAAEAARLKAIEDAKEAERMKKEAEEKAILAAARKAARQPDKKKIEAYIAAIKSIRIPELKTEDGKSIMASIQESINRFNDYATKKASEL